MSAEPRRGMTKQTKEEPRGGAENGRSAGGGTESRAEGRRAGSGEKRRGRANLTNILLAAVVIVGVCLVAYPSFSDWWNSRNASRAIVSYADGVASLDTETYAAMIEAAAAYNRKLFESGHGLGLDDSEIGEYESLLRLEDTDVMGYLEIDKIDVYLPICHGTSDSVLRTAIGHLEGSSLPVGGESTHCVLSGHRGLASARLFTDLDELAAGDTFVITTLNETLTYEVDQILIVLPDEVDALAIEEGMDYCTLVTCTPYGVNTHRLLVRGHRIDNASSAAVTADAVQISSTYVAMVIAVVMVLILLIGLALKPRGRAPRR